MSDGSSIEWCDATWQPVLGCTRVSAGCDHCYAISVVHRGMSPQHKGLTKLRPKDAARPGVDWNGTVRLQPEKLAEPLRWRKSRRVFVCSLADLFHDQVPFEYIAAVFGVMAACPKHTFLVLTKRPPRAREFFAWVAKRQMEMESEVDLVLACAADYLAGEQWDAALARSGLDMGYCECETWPLLNVHLGTSVEDQATADERIPQLLSCPAAVHWVSAEPLLGPVQLRKPMALGCTQWSCAIYHLEWLVIGGESGPGARPFDVAWARSLIEQARGLPTHVFVKQLGARPTWDDQRDAVITDDRKGGTMEDWPIDLRVREIPEAE